MTKVYKFKGKSKWAMVHKVDEKYGNYKIDVYLDEPSLKLYNESGCQMKIKEDEDGSYVTFRRANSQLMGTELVVFGKPKVVNKENEEINDLVGNGSEVVIKVEVFNTKNGVGHRLEGVCVLDLVPYEEKEEVKPEGLDDLPDF